MEFIWVAYYKYGTYLKENESTLNYFDIERDKLLKLSFVGGGINVDVREDGLYIVDKKIKIEIDGEELIPKDMESIFQFKVASALHNWSTNQVLDEGIDRYVIGFKCNNAHVSRVLFNISKTKPAYITIEKHSHITETPIVKIISTGNTKEVHLNSISKDVIL